MCFVFWLAPIRSFNFRTNKTLKLLSLGFRQNIEEYILLILLYNTTATVGDRQMCDGQRTASLRSSSCEGEIVYRKIRRSDFSCCSTYVLKPFCELLQLNYAQERNSICLGHSSPSFIFLNKKIKLGDEI